MPNTKREWILTLGVILAAFGGSAGCLGLEEEQAYILPIHDCETPGSGSSAPSGGQLSYTWTQIQPAAPLVQLDRSDPARPTFTAPEVTL